MDIWTKQEIANFANLLDKNAQRMVDLGKKWGGSPRTLLTYFAKSDQQIQDWYHDCATEAVGNCQNMLRAIVNKYLPESSDAPSRFYFCRPHRTRTCATLKTFSNAIKLEFFTALSQCSDTRQAAGFIYQACAKELKARKELLYYWPASTGYPGIDGALICDNAIFAFQITLSSTHTSPEPGVRKLRAQLPAKLKKLPWHVVFVGNMGPALNN
ncbi:hypothetical protein EV363DRAFT_1325384, partial [Boletus edulis]